MSFIKLFGVGLHLAVLMDATVVRATLVPAFMRLAGRAGGGLQHLCAESTNESDSAKRTPNALVDLTSRSNRRRQHPPGTEPVLAGADKDG